MVIEHALLPIIPGHEDAFEIAFAKAMPIISSMKGFQNLTLSRCIERPGTYMLIVQWEQLSDHIEGFRNSTQYLQWRQLLHHFYNPFPIVEHFEQINQV